MQISGLRRFFYITNNFIWPMLQTKILPLQQAKDLSGHPFKKIKTTPQTRLYITFLSDKTSSKLKIPYESPEKDFSILSVTKNEVISVLTLSANRSTTDVMKILEKEFGKKITTRNWNTVVKINNLWQEK